MTQPTKAAELPEALLPCPFCGHSGPLEFQDGSTHRWGVAYCANCGASSGETRRDYPDTGAWHLDAVAQWNTRAQPAPVREPLTPAQITAAAKKLAECMDYPWEHMPEQGRAEMRKHAQAVLAAAHGGTPPPPAP